MKKEHRQQIKRDEFVSGLEKAAQWAADHRDRLRIGLGLAVVAAATAGTVLYLQGGRKRDAERAFGEAVAIYRAPIAAELRAEADQPPGPVFPTAEEKYKTAAAAFDGVERRHGSLPVAVRARYYAALSRIELKQYAEAEKELKAIAEGRSATRLDAALARLALADLYRRQGQVDRAVDEYRAIAGDARLPLPRDYALMSLAETLEEAKRLAEAVAAYKRLIEEFPASVYAAQARRQAEHLRTAAQG